jgi:hypothetical protein
MNTVCSGVSVLIVICQTSRSHSIAVSESLCYIVGRNEVLESRLLVQFELNVHRGCLLWHRFLDERLLSKDDVAEVAQQKRGTHQRRLVLMTLTVTCDRLLRRGLT